MLEMTHPDSGSDGGSNAVKVPEYCTRIEYCSSPHCNTVVLLLGFLYVSQKTAYVFRSKRTMKAQIRYEARLSS